VAYTIVAPIIPGQLALVSRPWHQFGLVCGVLSVGGGRRPLHSDEPLAEVVHLMGEIAGRSAGMEL